MRVNMQTRRKARIEMLPLIDIVFLLLVFFIYAMLSMAVHRGLPVALPSSTTAKIDKSAPLSITLKEDGTIYVDREKTTLASLGKTLRGLGQTRKETGVLLFADRTVSYQRLFRVMDQIRISGITRISLQAEVEREP